MIARGAGPLLLSLCASGCVPMGYAAGLSATGGAATHGRATLQGGAELAGRLHAQGSRGITLAADADLLRPATAAPCCFLWRAGLGGGYAFVPRPFEGRVGWEALGRFAFGTAAPRADATLAAGLGARLSLLVRLTRDDSVWHQDRAPSAPVWFLVPFADATPMVPFDGSPASFEASAGLGLRASFYSLDAP